MVARVGQDDADVGERRLGEARRRRRPRRARARAPSRSLNSTTRVVSAGSTGGPMLPGRGDDRRRRRSGEGLVDRAVVAPVEHEDLRAAGELRARAGSRTGWRRWRSARTASCGRPKRRVISSPTQIASSVGSMSVDPARASARRRPRPPPRAHARSSRRCRPGRGRRTRCPSTSVNRAPDASSTNTGNGAGPLGHPVHRDAGEERAPRALEQLQRTRVRLLEAPLLAGLEVGEAGSVDGRDGHRRLRRTGWLGADPVYPA